MPCRHYAFAAWDALCVGVVRPRRIATACRAGGDVRLFAIDDALADASEGATIAIDGRTGENDGSAARRVLLRFANGERWALFWHGRANLIWRPSQSTLQFDANFTGWLRAAALGNGGAVAGGDGTGSGSALHNTELRALCTLEAHSDTIPSGGQVSSSIATAADSSSRGVLTSLRWQVTTMSGSNVDDAPRLLSLALPHHLEQLLTVSSTGTGTGTHWPNASTWFATHRGGMQPVAANEWKLFLPGGRVHEAVNDSSSVNQTRRRGLSPPWAFDAPFANCTMQEEAFWALHAASNAADPGQWGGSVYWSGKGWWRLARLVLLAAQLEDAELESRLHDILRRRVTEALSEDGPLAATHRFVYEPEWGGGEMLCLNRPVCATRSDACRRTVLRCTPIDVASCVVLRSDGGRYALRLLERLWRRMVQ